jgi:hypothetical protein
VRIIIERNEKPIPSDQHNDLCKALIEVAKRFRLGYIQCNEGSDKISLATNVRVPLQEEPPFTVEV